MRRHSVLRAIRMRKPEPATVCVLVLAAFFLFGGIAGNCYSQACDDASRFAFREYLADYCLLYDQNGVDISLGRCALLYLGNVCIAFLLGFSSLGLLLIPILSGLFGFTSFYTAACFVQAFGASGIVLAAALIVVRLIFTLPCFFLVASEALPLSFRLAALTIGRSKRVEPLSYTSRYFILFAFCLAVLCVGVCCERFLTPLLFRASIGELGSFF